MQKLLIITCAFAGLAPILLPSRAKPLAPTGGPTITVAAADATAAERLNATLRCDGVDDHLQLQSALNRIEGSGGSLGLTSGTFIIADALRAKGRVRMHGQGKATIIKAASSMQATALIDGTYTGAGAPLDLFELTDVTLDGSKFQGASCGGVLMNITSPAGFYHGSPDAHVTIDRVLVSRCTGHGVHITGGRNRAVRVDNVRVWDVDGDGFRVESADANYTDCDAGSSGGAGFRISSANVIVSGCKAWYSDDSGFVIAGVRGAYQGCSAQDNALHGFDIRAGMTTFASCHADSNSYLGTGNPDAHAGMYDGFHVDASHVTISSSFAYDKDEGGRGRNQRFGTYIAQGKRLLNLQVANGNGNTHDNRNGGIGGDTSGIGNHIIATGQDGFVTP